MRVLVNETFNELKTPIQLNIMTKEVDAAPTVNILICIIGVLLIIFSILLMWTSYGSYLERKKIYQAHVHRIRLQ